MQEEQHERQTERHQELDVRNVREDERTERERNRRNGRPGAHSHRQPSPERVGEERREDERRRG